MANINDYIGTNANNLSMLKQVSENGGFKHPLASIELFKKANDFDDPLSLGFKPFFHFTESYGLLADERFKNSALAYLKRIGDQMRYNALKLWIQTLKYISSKQPYLFQSISGLEEVQSNCFRQMMDTGETNIDFGMLETTDMKIQGLLHLYRTIVYDESRGIMVLPDNLRAFSMSIYIYPIHVYSVTTELEKSILPNTETNLDTFSNRPAQDLINFNHMMYEFKYCQFDLPKSGAGFFDKISNAEVEIVSNTISINYRLVRHSGLFKTIFGNNKINTVNFSLLQSISPKNSGIKKIALDFIKDSTAPLVTTVKDLQKKYTTAEGLKTLAQEAEQFALLNSKNIISNQLSRLYLGNVYDYNIANLVDLVNSRNVENQILRAAKIF